MNRILNFFLFCAVFFSGFLVCQNAQAAFYSVCSSGCDEITIQAVFNNNDLSGDDIVEVQAGTYLETVMPGANDSGASEHPVILRAKAGEAARIEGGGIRQIGINLSNVNYFTVDGFIVDNHISVSSASAFGIYALKNSQTGITVQHCTVNIDLSGTDYSLCSCTAAGTPYACCTGDQTGNCSDGRYGIAIGPSSYANKANNIIIHGNIITTDDGNTGAQTDGIRVSNSDTVTIDGNSVVLRNNNVYERNPVAYAHNDLYQVWNIQNLTFSNNYAFVEKNRPLGGQAVYLEEYNVGTDSSPTDYGTMNIYNNVIFGYGANLLFQVMSRTYSTSNCTGAGVPYTCCTGPATGCAVPPVVALNLYNNTFDAWDSIATNGSLPAKITNVHAQDIHNNIFVARRVSGAKYALQSIWPDINLDSLSLDNNYYYVPTASAGTDIAALGKTAVGYTWAELTAAYEANGIGYAWADPEFMSSTDFHLQHSSGAIGQGLTGLIGAAADKDGVARGAAWDIGAYEYVGAADTTAPAAPSGLLVQ